MKKLFLLAAFTGLLASSAVAGNYGDDKDKGKKECKKDGKACAGEKKEGCSKEGKSCCKNKSASTDNKSTAEKK